MPLTVQAGDARLQGPPCLPGPGLPSSAGALGFPERPRACKMTSGSPVQRLERLGLGGKPQGHAPTTCSTSWALSSMSSTRSVTW